MTITTPARVCLFGDHQDYLGLPIIACAIDRYMILQAVPTSNDYFQIQLPDIGETRRIHFEETLQESVASIDFLLSGMKVVQRKNCKPFSGYDITMSSIIPINAGVSSSSALVVSWMHFLANAFCLRQPVPIADIAQWAYEAEVLEHNSPGGKMDQYSIALGNILYLETGDQLNYHIFRKSIPGLILAESGIPKETIGTLSNVRGNTQEAIRLINEKHAQFTLENCSLLEANELAKELPSSLQNYFIAAVENHQITKKALEILESTHWDYQQLGELMYKHHTILRDRLRVSHPIIDQFIKKAMEMGAFGGKIVGSGGGGCAVLIAPPERKDAIIETLLLEGAKAAYTIYVSEGSHD